MTRLDRQPTPSNSATPPSCSRALSAGARARSTVWSAISLSRCGMRRRKKLLLARDFLGQRPLHYHRGRGFFAFASMAKGLHALADIPYSIDEQMMAEAVVLMPQTGYAHPSSRASAASSPRISSPSREIACRHGAIGSRNAHGGGRRNPAIMSKACVTTWIRRRNPDCAA